MDIEVTKTFTLKVTQEEFKILLAGVTFLIDVHYEDSPAKADVAEVIIAHGMGVSYGVKIAESLASIMKSPSATGGQ
jgi:hypothetical protein